MCLVECREGRRARKWRTWFSWLLSLSFLHSISGMIGEGGEWEETTGVVPPSPSSFSFYSILRLFSAPLQNVTRKDLDSRIIWIRESTHEDYRFTVGKDYVRGREITRRNYSEWLTESMHSWREIFFITLILVIFLFISQSAANVRKCSPIRSFQITHQLCLHLLFCYDCNDKKFSNVI